MKHRKFWAILLSIVMILGSMSMTAFAAPAFPDIPNDWSTQALQSAIDHGYLSGIDGKLEPKGKLTRAQIASSMNRVFGNTEKGDLSAYSDVPQSAWYYDDMAKAVAAGIFVGNNGKLHPQANITRQEVCSIFARAYKLADGKEASLSKFSNAAEISSWAKGSVAALVEAGIVNGSDGRISPNAEMTRAEFAVILYHANGEKAPDTQVSAENIFDKAGTYTQVEEGNVTISAPGVELKDVKITGDLILTEGVGTGEVTLTNVTVEGNMLVQGGGENSVILDNCILSEVKIENKTSPVRILSKNNTKIESISAFTSTIFEGNFHCDIQVMSEKLEIRGVVDKLIISASSIITITSGSIKDIEVKEIAPNTSIIVTASGKVEKIEVRGVKTEITGSGKITFVQVGANNVVISVPGTKVTVEKEITGTKVGKVEIEGGKTATVSDNGNRNNGSSGSSNDTKYSVEIVTMLDGVTSTSATTRIPRNSTLINWVAPEIEGYVFEALYTTSDLTTPYPLDTLVTSNEKLYAKYRKDSYVVTVENYYMTVDKNGVEAYVAKEAKTYTVKSGQPFSADNTLTYGSNRYDLAGLYENAEMINGKPSFSVPVSNVTVDSDRSLAAKYTREKFVTPPKPTVEWTVTIHQVIAGVDKNIGSAKVKDGDAYIRDKTMLPDIVTTSDGKQHQWKEFRVGSATGPVYQGEPMTADTDLYAIYKEEPLKPAVEWTISIYQVIAGVDKEIGSAKVEDGAAYIRDKTMVPDTVITDTDGREYKWKEFRVGSAIGPVYQGETISKDTDLYAIYEPVWSVTIYQVINDLDLNLDSVKVENNTAYTRDKTMLPDIVTTSDGKKHMFKEIRVGSKDGTVYNNEPITTDICLYAIYEPVVWTVTIHQVIKGADKEIGSALVEDGAAYTRDETMLPDIATDDDRKKHIFKEIRVGSKDGTVYQGEPITTDTDLYAIYEPAPIWEVLIYTLDPTGQDNNYFIYAVQIEYGDVYTRDVDKLPDIKYIGSTKCEFKEMRLHGPGGTPYHGEPITEYIDTMYAFYEPV